MKKISSISAIILFLALSVFSINTEAQTFEDTPNDLLNQLAGNSVEGIWNLNTEESDDPVSKIQTFIQKSFALSEKEESAEQTEIPRISISLFPPERLVMAGNENEMTINEFYLDVISTRTFINDGLTHSFQTENNFYITVRARKENNKLLIETLSPRGNRMKETFELFANGSKLKVLIQISDANLQEVLRQRVYNRAILDDFSDYN
jgi:hypothetical protein